MHHCKLHCGNSCSAVYLYYLLTVWSCGKPLRMDRSVYIQHSVIHDSVPCTVDYIPSKRIQENRILYSVWRLCTICYYAFNWVYTRIFCVLKNDNSLLKQSNIYRFMNYINIIDMKLRELKKLGTMNFALPHLQMN